MRQNINAEEGYSWKEGEFKNVFTLPKNMAIIPVDEGSLRYDPMTRAIEKYDGLVLGWNPIASPVLDADLVTIAGLAPADGSILQRTAGAWSSRTLADYKTDLALNLVENTALSTWAGSTNVTTLGTIVAGTWNGAPIPVNRAGVPSGGSAGQVLKKVSGTDYDYAWSADLTGGGGGALIDTDYGDIVVSGTGTIMTIDAGAVNSSKIADLAVTTVKINNLAVTDAKLATGIDAAKLADGTVSNTEFQYINSLNSNAQTQLDGKVSALATIGSSPNANGASISGNILTLQPASASFGGVVTTSAQTFAGEKTILVSSAETANAQNVLTLRAESSGTAGSGFGVALTMAAKTSNGTVHESNVIFSQWIDATTASRSSILEIRGYHNAGATLPLSIFGDGYIRLNTYTASKTKGTAAYGLAVNGDGDIVTVALGGGGGTTYSFTANDFNQSGTTISIDYANGQAASGSTKGFLTAADWTTFNNKQATLVSGTSIKTINGTSLLGAGDISISGSISDGDKGDITVSSSGTVWTVDNNAITTAKINNGAVTDAKIASLDATKLIGLIDAARFSGTATDNYVLTSVGGMPVWQPSTGGVGSQTLQQTFDEGSTVTDEEMTFATATGTGRNFKIYNNSEVDGVGFLAVKSTAANSAPILRLLPSGSGFSSGAVNSALDIFNTSDLNNQEYLRIFGSTGNNYNFISNKSGTGVARGFDFTIETDNVMSMNRTFLSFKALNDLTGVAKMVTSTNGVMGLAAIPSGGTVDSAIVNGSSNAVAGNAVFDALALKAGAIRLSEMGIVSDADLSYESSTFGTDQLTAINTILATASATNPLYIIWDVKISVSGAIRIKSYTHIHFTAGSGVILRDDADDVIFRTFNWNAPFQSIENYNISITGAGIINGNGWRGGLEQQVLIHSTRGVLTGMNLANIKGLVLKDFTILNARCFAFMGINLEDAVIDNITIDQGAVPNITQDGLEMLGGMKNVSFTNSRIRAGDDRIIFCPNPANSIYGTAMPWAGADKDIDGIRIDNINFWGPGKGFRLQSTANALKNVYISNIYGTAKTGVLWLENGDALTTDFPSDAGNGNFENIVFENIHVEVTADMIYDYAPDMVGIYMVNGECKNISFRNVVRNSLDIDRPTFTIGNNYTVGFTVQDLTIEGYYSYEATATGANFPHVKVMGNATVSGLRVSNTRIVHDTNSGSDIINVTAAGILYNVLLNNVAGHNITHFLDDLGTVSSISATMIRHTGNTTDATFKTNGTVDKIVCSNYNGTDVLDGTFTAQSGDAFSSGGTNWLNSGIDAYLIAGAKAGIGSSTMPATLNVTKTDGTLYSTWSEIARFSNKTTDYPTYSQLMSIMGAGDGATGAIGFNMTGVGVVKENSARSSGMVYFNNSLSAGELTTYQYYSAPQGSTSNQLIFGSDAAGEFTIADLAGNGTGIVAVDNTGKLSWSAGGGGGSNWTVVGSDLRRDSKVGIDIDPAAKLHIYENDVNGTGVLRIQNDAAAGTNKFLTIRQSGSTAYGIASWVDAAVIEGLADGGMSLSAFGGDMRLTTGASRTVRIGIANAGDITLPTLATGTTANVLYYDTTTKTVTYGAAPSGGGGMTNPMTTTGDIIYASSGSTPARLAAGTNGHVLTLAGGVPTWAAPSGGGTTETASNGLTKVTNDIRLGGLLTANTTISGGDTRTLDLGDIASQLSRLSVYSTGLIQLNGRIQVISHGSGDGNFSIPANGSYIGLHQITANRTVTFPSSGAGEIVFIHNSNSSAFSWQVSGTVQDAAGNSITSLTNDSAYIFIHSGSAWVKFN